MWMRGWQHLQTQRAPNAVYLGSIGMCLHDPGICTAVFKSSNKPQAAHVSNQSHAIPHRKMFIPFHDFITTVPVHAAQHVPTQWAPVCRLGRKGWNYADAIKAEEISSWVCCCEILKSSSAHVGEAGACGRQKSVLIGMRDI